MGKYENNINIFIYFHKVLFLKSSKDILKKLINIYLLLKKIIYHKNVL